MGMNSVFKGLILTIAGHITSYLSLIVFSSIISHENNFRTGNNYDINVDNNGYILICKYFILILEMVLFSQKMTRLQAWLRNRSLVPDRNQTLPLFRSLWLMADFLPGKESRCLLNKILSVPRSRDGFFGKKKNFLLLADMKKILPFSDTYPSHCTESVNLAPRVMLLRTLARFRKLRWKCNEQQFLKCYL